MLKGIEIMNRDRGPFNNPFGKESDSVKPGKMTIIQPTEKIEV